MPPDGPIISLSPIDILRKAIVAVPAVKYALGVAGVAAAAAILVFFLGKSSNNIFLLGLVFVGMVLLFLFATLINSPSRSKQLAGEVLIWGVLSFFFLFLIFTTSAFVTGLPCNWTNLLTLDTHQSCSTSATRLSPPTSTPSLPQDRGAKTATCGGYCAASFTVDLHDRPGEPELRFWARRADHWEEHHPNGLRSRHSIAGRISLDDCDGTKTLKDSDRNLEFFIPDIGCGGMIMMSRYNKVAWYPWRPMQDVKSSASSP
jgi:hypothetical protein